LRKMEWVSSKHHMTVEHSLSSMVQTPPADTHKHTSAPSSWMNCHTHQGTGTHHFTKDEIWFLRMPLHSNCSIHLSLFWCVNIYPNIFARPVIYIV
jgi:hypothetical protein